MSPAERTYRLALRAYPRRHRDERGEEMLAVLLAVPGPRVPEVASLVRHGLVARVRAERRGPGWGPTLGVATATLAALLVVVAAGAAIDTGIAAWLLPQPGARPWVDPLWPVYSLWTVCLLALLGGRHRLAAAAAWLALALHVLLLVGLLDGSPGSGGVPVLPGRGAVALLLPALVLAVLATSAPVGAGLRLVGSRVLLLAVAAGIATALLRAVDLRVDSGWSLAVTAAVLAARLRRTGLLLRWSAVLVAALAPPALAHLDAARAQSPLDAAALLTAAAVVALAGVAPLLVAHEVELREELSAARRERSRRPPRPLPGP